MLFISKIFTIRIVDIGFVPMQNYVFVKGSAIMFKFISVLLASLFLLVSGCNSSSAQPTGSQGQKSAAATTTGTQGTTSAGSLHGKKVLIAFFSYSNHTKDFAEIIQQKTGGDLLRLEPVKPYSTDANVVLSQGQKEVREGFKPPLKNKGDISQYDVIFVGTPVWEYSYSPSVLSFLSSHDFNGKIVIPFTTHMGSGLAGIDEKIRKMYPKATVLQGLAIRNDTAKASVAEINAWLQKLGF